MQRKIFLRRVIGLFFMVGVLTALAPGQQVEAIDICYKEKSSQSQCGATDCNRLPTSLLILSDDIVAPSHDGWTPGSYCGWKYCSTFTCKCGEKLSKNTCQGSTCA
jgi:hypothetical protein